MHGSKEPKSEQFNSPRKCKWKRRSLHQVYEQRPLVTRNTTCTRKSTHTRTCTQYLLFIYYVVVTVESHIVSSLHVSSIFVYGPRLMARNLENKATTSLHVENPGQVHCLQRTRGANASGKMGPEHCATTPVPHPACASRATQTRDAG